MGDIGKRGQVTLFIIIGIAIVGVIIFLGVTKKLPFVGPGEAEKINIDECISGSVDNALKIILPQGGLVNPTNYYSFKGQNVAFLCYTNKFYEKCIVQEPFLEQGIKKGLEDYVGSRIKDCFYAVEQDYKDRGYYVESKPMAFSVEIMPNKISIIINKSLIFTKGEERKVYSDFKINRASSLFYLLTAVHDAIEQEAKSCNFDQVIYGLLHPEFKIIKNTIGTEVKVYNIKSKKTGEEISFAVRGCALPNNALD